MAGILGLLPDAITPGETLDVTVTHADATPAAGYTLAYRFAAPTPITVAGVDNGSGGWTVTLTATQSLTLTRGDMAFDALVTLAGVATCIDRGTIYVYPSPLATSQWRAVLASVDAAIVAQATSGEESGSFTVGELSKSYTYRSRSDLLALRAFCLREIARDTGKARPYRILSRFGL